VTAGRPAVFLDRDGILNELVRRDGATVSPRSPVDFRLREEAAAAVRDLRAAGFPVLVVTNQPDIARGHMTRAALDAMNGMLRAAMPVNDVAVCPHDEADRCECRKPKPGLLLGLASRWDVDLPRSYMVGDGWRDIGAGRAAGCRTILVGDQPGGDAEPELAVADLRAAVTAILRLMHPSMLHSEPR
jgi:D-glycero-D-manno-heptose 1,7-bisphosphate phosphatase